VVAHKGIVRWRCQTHGRATHSAAPAAGDNAVYKMARVLAAYQQYADEEVGRLASHDLCGPATLSVGMIRGGQSVNTVPDLCTIEIDRRLLPDEDPAEAYQHAVDYVARRADIDFPVENQPPYIQGLTFANKGNGELADALGRVVEQVTGSCRQVGVSYGTHAAFFAAAGVPTVVFGPGSIKQAHTKDEWVTLDQVEQAAEIIYRFCSEGP